MTMIVTVMMQTTRPWQLFGSQVELSPDYDHGDDEEEEDDNDHDHDDDEDYEDDHSSCWFLGRTVTRLGSW